MSRNIKLTIEYDGTDYAGWQAQENALGIQTVIERALARVLNHPVRLTAAGRTDAGVHARGQIANFQSDATVPTEGLLKAVNHRLPRDIAILRAEEVPQDFNARRSAVRRTYLYTILNRSVPSAVGARFVWHYPVPLPVDVWDALGRELVGTHDFSSFQKVGSARVTPVSVVHECRSWSTDDHVYVSITARSYLRGMVRAIVGTFQWLAPDVNTELGLARDRIHGILEARERSAAGNAAPPQGLSLVQVDYE